MLKEYNCIVHSGDKSRAALCSSSSATMSTRAGLEQEYAA